MEKDREGFEKWVENRGYNLEVEDGTYDDPETRGAFYGFVGRQPEIDALRAENERLRSQLLTVRSDYMPEGWKLVPVEPTEEMRAAAEHEIDRSAVLNYGSAPNYEDLWSWMLAAAPTPPTQDDEPVAYLDDNGDIWSICDAKPELEDGNLLNLRPLYTRPDNSKLRKAAVKYLKSHDHGNADERRRDVENLRAALEGK